MLMLFIASNKRRADSAWVGKMSRLPRDGTAKPVSGDQILRRERGQGKMNFPCSADQERDWQIYPVDPYSAETGDHTNYQYHLDGG